MNKKNLLAALGLALVTLTGCTNVTSIGRVNGVELTRVTTRGVFSPSTTTVLAHSPEVPGELSVIANASGPGVLPACATAGGIAGGAALLRPSRVNNTTENSTVVNGGNTTSTGGNGFVPPGHVSNPSQQH
jgi:hypothetical protein